MVNVLRTKGIINFTGTGIRKERGISNADNHRRKGSDRTIWGWFVNGKWSVEMRALTLVCLLYLQELRRSYFL